MRVAAIKKYGSAQSQNQRLDYVLNFLDSLENDLLGFIKSGYEKPEPPFNG